MTAYGASGSDSEDVEHTVDDSTCPGQQGYQQLGYQKGYQQDGPPSKPQKRTMRSKAKKMRAKLRGAPSLANPLRAEISLSRAQR